MTTCKQCNCTLDASCDLDGLAFCGDECVFRYAMALDVMKPPIGEIRLDSLVRSKPLSPKALAVFQEGLAQARTGEFVEGPDVAADLAKFAGDLDYVIDKNRELYDNLAKQEDRPMPGPLSTHYADFKWIKVRRHVDDPSLTWEERYNELSRHHAKETGFLIAEVRKLAAEVDRLEGESSG